MKQMAKVVLDHNIFERIFFSSDLVIKLSSSE